MVLPLFPLYFPIAAIEGIFIVSIRGVTNFVADEMVGGSYPCKAV